MNSRCASCSNTRAENEDPRCSDRRDGWTDGPLCDECAIDALRQVEEELENEIVSVQEKIESIEAKTFPCPTCGSECATQYDTELCCQFH